MKKTALIALTAVVALSGCTQRIADLTVASTKNMEVNKSQFEKGNRITGQDLKPVILFPLGIPNVEEAMDNAIEKDKCAVGLSDVTIESGAFSFLVGAIWYDVEGDLIIDKSIRGCENWKYDPKKFAKKPNKGNSRQYQ